MAHAFSSLDELGDGPGFRKIRSALGVTAFGVNAVVYPPGPSVRSSPSTATRAVPLWTK
jgi:hypothetical protein